MSAEFDYRSSLLAKFILLRVESVKFEMKADGVEISESRDVVP